MKNSEIKINWPNGTFSISRNGTDWLQEARKAGVKIPTGCLNGSCGACEINVNGVTIRACISKIKKSASSELNVEFWSDPYW